MSNVKIIFGLSNRTVLLHGGRVCAQRIWARQMSTCGNNLIESIRTRLVDGRPQNHWKKARLLSRRNLNIDCNAKKGGVGRADCPVRLLWQSCSEAVSNHSFDRQRSIESVG